MGLCWAIVRHTTKGVRGGMGNGAVLGACLERVLGGEHDDVHQVAVVERVPEHAVPVARRSKPVHKGRKPAYRAACRDACTAV